MNRNIEMFQWSICDNWAEHWLKLLDNYLFSL